MAVVPGVMASTIQATILTMIVQEQNAGGTAHAGHALPRTSERVPPATAARKQSPRPASPDAYRAFAACIGPNSCTFSGRSLR